MIFNRINKEKIFLLGIILVLISSIWVNPINPKDIIETKEIMFHRAVFACLLLTSILSLLFKIRYSFHVVDVLIGLFVVNLIITYNFQQSLAPEKLLYTLQLYTFLWVLRIIISHIPTKDILLLISLLGVVAGLWGVLQIFDLLPSSHPLFPITGPFYNPGPYGGFLAICLVISLGNMISVDNKKLKSFYMGCAVFPLIVLPSTLSRTAWLGAFVAIFFLLYLHPKSQSILCKYIPKSKVLKRGLLLLFTTIGIAFFCFIYFIKKDSADGRLFMMKMTINAIKQSPFNGNGLGSFANQYAQSQITYFKENPLNEQEIMIAGSPEYAFNEYLQIWLEHGLCGLLLYIAILLSCLYFSIKNKRYAIVAGWVCFIVFSFFSYPLQLPSFPILLAILIAISLPIDRKVIYKYSYHKYKLTSGLFILTICSYLLLNKKLEYHKSFTQWKPLETMYQLNGNNDFLNQKYNSLYPCLNHNPEFLFQYAQITFDTKDYAKSIQLLKRAILVSNDPMFYNMLSKNYIELKRYKEAADALVTSTHLAPARIYPFYLLMKLYYRKEFHNKKQLKKYINIVKYKKPKVNSPAVLEMKKEAEKIEKLYYEKNTR